MNRPKIIHDPKPTHAGQSSESISANETNMPRIGTRGTQGVRKGRGTSGRLTRMIQTPRQTIVKARRVPRLTSFARKTIGKKAARNATKHPMTMEVRYGVRKRG